VVLAHHIGLVFPSLVAQLLRKPKVGLLVSAFCFLRWCPGHLLGIGGCSRRCFSYAFHSSDTWWTPYSSYLGLSARKLSVWRMWFTSGADH